MGEDDNDGSDAPDWSLAEGFRTGGDHQPQPCDAYTYSAPMYAAEPSYGPEEPCYFCRQPREAHSWENTSAGRRPVRPLPDTTT